MQGTPAPVSCYIRTKNEQKNIERCILAAQAVASEVIVVDSDSTDQTVAIAERCGAKVFRQSWLGNGFQKRFAEERCTYDFLLDLDADEVVSPELAQEIAALFVSGTRPASIYAPPLVLVSPAGKYFRHSGIAWRNKLYDRRVVRMPEHRMWDQLEVPAGVRTARLSSPLYHFAYRDLAHLVDKMNKVSTARTQETDLPSTAAIKLRLIFAWPFYFLKHYIGRRYFLAGTEGFTTAVVLSFGRWLRDAKRLERVSLEKQRRAKEMVLQNQN